MTLAIHNGQLIDRDQTGIPLMNKGYYFDFAVYSSLKVIQGKPFFPDFHVDRLLDSAKIIGIEHVFSKKQILSWIEMLLSTKSSVIARSLPAGMQAPSDVTIPTQAEKSTRLRRHATSPTPRNDSKENTQDVLLRLLLIGDMNGSDANLYIFPVTGITYYPNDNYSQGVKTITYQGERRFPTAKTTDLLLSFVALREAKKKGAFEALMVDRDGFIREGTRSNFFAVKGKSLFIPPNERTLLGVTKMIILDLVKDELEIVEADIPLSEIGSYDECFLTSTLMNVMPIAQIDDVLFESPFTSALHISNLYKEYYNNHVLK